MKTFPNSFSSANDALGFFNTTGRTNLTTDASESYDDDGDDAEEDENSNQSPLGVGIVKPVSRK